MPGQQGFDHAGLALQRIGLHFPLALQRPERLGHRQHVGSRRTVEMMCQKPIDLRGLKPPCACSIKLIVEDDGVSKPSRQS